ncbi:Holliday junction resolvase RuvX [Candidatus Kaiserbacteria bacterium]|nr:Holliday junction resolvase RuvX [Candidatus Kaiserbacteria bacterium]
MRYLGIDYGSKRVGIALSNSEGTIAFPRETIAFDANLITNLARTTKKEKVDAIVVGDTRTFSGYENPITKEAKSFATQLQVATALPVHLVWESGSSIEAGRYAPEGAGHDDAVAAAIILQRFIDMKVNRVE